MDRLEEAIRRLTEEFNSLTDEIGSNVQIAAKEECDRSLASLAEAQAPDGIVAAAEHARDQLRHVISEYRRFLVQADQLEQVWLISEDLKQVVKAMQKNV